MTKRLLVLLLILSFAAASSLASDPNAKPKPTPDAALALLKEGNARFVAGKSAHPHSDPARLAQAGKENQGDHAYATVLGCSDSRVPPERLFDAGVMDLFVVRVAGNVANTDEIGSMEYGMIHVRTPVLVILGHTQCGAVTAVTQAVSGHGHPLERNIPPLVAPIIPAVKKTMEANPGLSEDKLIPKAIEQNVWQGVENVFLRSPALRALAKEGRIKVVGAVYDVGAGRVDWLADQQVGEILAKAEADPKRETKAMAD
jgi:carbonic anhydrase